MSIYRVKKNKDFFVASNEPFNDERLSWEARGIMGYLLSKTDGWELREQDLVSKGPAGKHKIKRAVNELKEYGYIRRIRERNADGTFAYVTEIYETPRANPDYKATTEQAANRLSVDGSSANGKPGPLVNTESVNTNNGLSRSDERPARDDQNSSRDGYPLRQQPLLADDTTAPAPSANSKQVIPPERLERARREPSAHQQVMAAYAAELDYPIPNGAKEGRAAKKIVSAGYTADEVAACYRHLKGDRFWQGKHLSLHTVFEQLGPWKAAHQPQTTRGIPATVGGMPVWTGPHGRRAS